MANADKTRLIEAYYEGNLTGSEKSHFKQLMNEDSNFNQDVNEYKQIFGGLDALHVESFQSNLAKMERKYDGKVVAMNDTTVVHPLKKFYFAAAAIALLICSTFAYNIFMTDVYEDNFHASQSIAVHMASIRGTDAMTEAEQIKKTAFSAYQAEDYTRCINQLKDYMITYPELADKDYQSILVLGVAQLASDNPEKAVQNLKTVMDSKDSSYQQEAEWMWVLAQFKMDKGNTPATKAALTKIINQKGHIHQKAATKILDGM